MEAMRHHSESAELLLPDKLLGFAQSQRNREAIVDLFQRTRAFTANGIAIERAIILALDGEKAPAPSPAFRTDRKISPRMRLKLRYGHLIKEWRIQGFGYLKIWNLLKVQGARNSKTGKPFSLATVRRVVAIIEAEQE